ncbi:uncharacterized protein SOCEGT47_065870 [Sorangium cellulosum]|uniref:SUKH-3 domain containing protein n=1 Tax=Sorangium cellulosum TaxID=56 RepID=A0A4P2Q8W0_SORCE|nr:SUKH-3 domain-containing protein [Sorangium cellulosum]AUX26034.1 uncharacterized protein SOCEGT47_065870 [Sorangium cellulosum]
MTHRFSPATEACLKRAGWRPGRSVRTDHWESLLRAANNPVHASVVDFLREFGGLRVVHPHHRVPGKQDYFHINPSIAAKEFPIREDGLYDDNERVGAPLCAIGTACRDYMLLIMDAAGKVYASMDDYLFLVGNSGFEALESLCTPHEWAEIPQLRESSIYRGS